jgi:hypothetical protein
MPLEGLDAYAIDYGIDSRDAAYVQKTPEYDIDAIPTEADSNDQRSEEQRFDGRSDGQSDSDQHTPAQKDKLQRYSSVSHSEDVVGPSDLESSIVSDRIDTATRFFGPIHCKRGFKQHRIQ